MTTTNEACRWAANESFLMKVLNQNLSYICDQHNPLQLIGGG